MTELNEGYANSKIPLKGELLCVKMTNIEEGTNTTKLLFGFSGIKNGHFGDAEYRGKVLSHGRVLIERRLNRCIEKLNPWPEGKMNCSLVRIGSTQFQVFSCSYVFISDSLKTRNTADIAFLLVSDAVTGSCGVAFGNHPYIPFGLAKHKCARGYYTFGHEIGHIMGTSHNREEMTNGTNGYNDYSYGWLMRPKSEKASAGYRTIMAQV